jgi:hypothetical protein
MAGARWLPAAPTTTGPEGIPDRTMAVRWRQGRRLAVGAAFPTSPSARDVAALQALLLRVARGLE